MNLVQNCFCKLFKSFRFEILSKHKVLLETRPVVLILILESGLK